MNLWTETNEKLWDNGHYWDEVLWVGSHTAQIPLDHFRTIADSFYDAGYGSPEIPLDLMVVGPDWWLERHEYDGAEWWEFKQYPIEPSREVRPKKIRTNGYETLKEAVDREDKEE
jgi:hypothetical protein